MNMERVGKTARWIVDPVGAVLNGDTISPITLPASAALYYGGYKGVEALTNSNGQADLAEQAAQYNRERTPDVGGILTPAESDLIMQQALFQQQRQAEIQAIRASAEQRAAYQEAARQQQQDAIQLQSMQR